MKLKRIEIEQFINLKKMMSFKSFPVICKGASFILNAHSTIPSKSLDRRKLVMKTNVFDLSLFRFEEINFEFN